MIPRYTRPEMAALWAPETKFRIWLDIERLACEAQEALGAIPAGTAAVIAERGTFEIGRIDAIERETKHDVIAFLTNVAEHVGAEARFMHMGMTSSDVLDTCFAVQLTRAADILLADIDALLAALERRAREHKFTPCIGRSHGVHAEPTTFGLKLAQAYAEFARHRARLETARREVATCAVSGAVGTFAGIDPAVEAHVARRLRLAPEPISTQVIPRDRHAAFFAALAGAASSIERAAIEIRHLQRTELREAEEFFAAGQKGSSAMPHKRNPVLAENLTGLARLVRAAIVPALENVALWHERDISHSSVERGIAPDATATLDFALARLVGVVNELTVDPAAMRRNMEMLGGLIHSQQALLALARAGMSREAAYAAVQRNAMRVWRDGGDFRAALGSDEDIASRLDPAALDAAFDLDRHFAHVATLFSRVFGDPPETTADDVLAFWFGEAGPERWFAADPAFDSVVASRLGAAHERAAAGALDSWRADPKGCLALILLLDQAPRNMFRGAARAFASDAQARAAADGAVRRRFDRDPAFDDARRQFFYMPFMHSEDIADQNRCIALAEARLTGSDAADYARRHRAVIARFGRFPHRNAALGRAGTPAETAWLAAGGETFEAGGGR